MPFACLCSTHSCEARSQKKMILGLPAGSERNNSSGATGERLKEACSINQSLTTLGRSVPSLNSPASLQPIKDQCRLDYLAVCAMGPACTLNVISALAEWVP